MAQPTEFVIRAAGADKAALRHLVARFPLAFRPDPGSQATAQAPDLRQDHQGWVMGQMEEEDAKPGTRSLPGQWVLEERSGRPRFVGQPEGGPRDAGAGYFLLMKGKGNEFHAVPVSDVFTFKPALQRRSQTLEEAEEAMKAQRQQHERANPRLARAVARDEEDPLAILRDEDEADSDEEWKGIKARAAARHVVKTAPQAQQQRRPGSGGGGGDEEEPEEEQAEREEKGEDWEHEEAAADDDLDMGESEEDVGMSPVRAKGAASSDSEGEEGGAGGAGGALQPEKAKRRLRRMMRETGLEDSDADEDEGEEESESIMDEEDLDRMVSGGAAEAGVAAATSKREPTPEPAAAAAAAAGGGGGRKRKSPTPPPAGAVQALRGPDAAAAAGGEAKRARTAAAAAPGAEAAGAAAAAAARPAAAAAAARPAAAAAPASGCSVTAEELRRLFRVKGRVLLKDLTDQYKARLSGPDGQKAFVRLVKEVARIEPGSKYLVLKD